MEIGRPGIAFLLILLISCAAYAYGIQEAAMYMLLLMGGIVLYKMLTAKR